MLSGQAGSPALLAGLRPVFTALRHYLVDTIESVDAAGLQALRNAGVRPLTGGRNNTMFTATVAGRAVCIKVHRADGRRRERREWDALTALASLGVPISPTPLCYDPSPPSVMALGWLPGTGLGQSRLSAAQVAAFAAAQRQLHAITPNGVALSLLPVRLSDQEMLAQVQRFFTTAAARPMATLRSELRGELRTRWAQWSQGPDTALLAQPAPIVFGQGDPNLTNCLWDDDQQALTLIDFEYAGWSNRAYELALLIEHVQSRRTPDIAWHELLEQSDLYLGDRRRILAARRLVAWFWTTTFWPAGAVVDDVQFTHQAHRVLQVLRERDP